MSDARLIHRVAWFLHPENLEDCENEDDLKEKAKILIAIVRRSDRRRVPPLTCDICGKPAIPPVFCEDHKP